MGILKNKVAIVTGGAQGIGKNIAFSMHKEEANVVIVDLKEGIERFRKEGNVPAGFTVIEADVSRKEQIERMVAEVLERFRRIDILVNSAGICECCPVEELSEAQWDRMMAVNLKGVLFSCQAVLPIMKKQRYGKIINISSVAAKTGGLAAGAHYAVSKAGVLCLTKCFARAVAPYGINVNSVAPAITDTKMINIFTPNQKEELIRGIPVGRLGRPEDTAGTVLFLASDKASFITGETINVDGGTLME